MSELTNPETMMTLAIALTKDVPQPKRAEVHGAIVRGVGVGLAIYTVDARPIDYILSDILMNLATAVERDDEAALEAIGDFVSRATAR